MRRFLTATALTLSTGLGLFSVQAPARAECSSFSYGIGSCVNQGTFRSGYSSPSSSRYRSDDRPMLLEQPRFQPSFGSRNDSYGNSYPSSSWGW